MYYGEFVVTEELMCCMFVFVPLLVIDLSNFKNLLYFRGKATMSNMPVQPHKVSVLQCIPTMWDKIIAEIENSWRSICRNTPCSLSKELKKRNKSFPIGVLQTMFSSFSSLLIWSSVARQRWKWENQAQTGQLPFAGASVSEPQQL